MIHRAAVPAHPMERAGVCLVIPPDEVVSAFQFLERSGVSCTGTRPFRVRMERGVPFRGARPGTGPALRAPAPIPLANSVQGSRKLPEYGLKSAIMAAPQPNMRRAGSPGVVAVAGRAGWCGRSLRWRVDPPPECARRETGCGRGLFAPAARRGSPLLQAYNDFITVGPYNSTRSSPRTPISPRGDRSTAGLPRSGRTGTPCGVARPRAEHPFSVAHRQPEP